MKGEVTDEEIRAKKEAEDKKLKDDADEIRSKDSQGDQVMNKKVQEEDEEESSLFEEEKPKPVAQQQPQNNSSSAREGLGMFASDLPADELDEELQNALRISMQQR